jgi:hypothetical protein
MDMDRRHQGKRRSKYEIIIHNWAISRKKEIGQTSGTRPRYIRRMTQKRTRCCWDYCNERQNLYGGLDLRRNNDGDTQTCLLTYSWCWRHTRKGEKTSGSSATPANDYFAWISADWNMIAVLHAASYPYYSWKCFFCFKSETFFTSYTSITSKKKKREEGKQILLMWHSFLHHLCAVNLAEE